MPNWPQVLSAVYDAAVAVAAEVAARSRPDAPPQLGRAQVRHTRHAGGCRRRCLSSFSLAWSLATAPAAAATTTAATAVALRRDAGSYRRPLSACTVDKKHSNRTRSLSARAVRRQQKTKIHSFISISIYTSTSTSTYECIHSPC